MIKSIELQPLSDGAVIARQGQEAAAMYVLQRGKLASKLVAKPNDDAAIAEADPVEVWDAAGTIIGAESVMAGRYIETIVAKEGAEVLTLPVTTDELLARFKASPKIGLAFGRSLARRVMHANKSLTSSQSRVAKLDSELGRIYSDFYNIVNGIASEAEGEDLILDAIKDGKSCKTFSVGRGLSDDSVKATVAMTRVIESYEMTGKQHKLKKGEALCRAGDPGTSMFIVMKGKLAVIVMGTKVGEIAAGETVGEITVLLGQNQQRTADLVAEEATIVGIIPGDQFEKLACAQPTMLLQILRAMVKRVDNNYSAMADHETKEYQSVMRYLGKPDVDAQADYRALAEKLGELIEEYEFPLYREVDLLERGVEKLGTLKARYADWISGAVAGPAPAKADAGKGGGKTIKR